MHTVHCPACGADVVFQSSLSVYAVCRYCNASLVRHDVNVESVGTMAALPDDISPFQLGTEGMYQGRHFRIIGRVKMGWDAGSWNEWFLLMDNGRKGWLAEAQGAYAICFEEDDPFTQDARELLFRQVPELKVPYAGYEGRGSELINENRTLDLDDVVYRVCDIKWGTCIGSEGELPYEAPVGRTALSVDLLGPRGAFACIEMHHGNLRLFTGRYVEWDDLQCHNVRELEGWKWTK